MKRLDTTLRDNIVYTPTRPKQPGHKPTVRDLNRAERANNIKRARWLKSRMKDVCAQCGATDHLQMDVIDGNTAGHHDMNYSRRLTWYIAQWANGNLQLLCPACHTTKTLADMAKRHIGAVSCPHCGEVINLGSPTPAKPSGPLT